MGLHPGEDTMPEFKPVTGHCQCGAVAFRVEAPPHDIYHCHCSMCRRCHGTMFATYALAPKDKVTVTKGADNLTTFVSSPGVYRQFCKTCGCQMFIDVDESPNLRWYMPGVIDGHPGHTEAQMKHIYVESKVDWYELADDLPKLTRYEHT
jgi:hypothetical protein